MCPENPQEIPEEGIELLLRTLLLAIQHDQHKRHRRQRAQCPLRNVQRQLPPRRFAYHARVLADAVREFTTVFSTRFADVRSACATIGFAFAPSGP